MGEIIINILIVILFIIIILLHIEKKKVSGKLTKIVIKNNLENDLNLSNEVTDIKNINEKYGVGLKNSKMIYNHIKSNSK